MTLVAISKTSPIAMLPAGQVGYGIVLEPDVVDEDGNSMSAAVEKAAHRFMEDYAQLVAEVGMRGDALSRHEVAIVESMIAPADFRLGNQLVQKGSWVIAIKFNDEGTWKAVQAGEYTGLRFEGFGRRIRDN